MHPDYSKNRSLYEVNKLIFEGENSLKNSSYISQIIIPPESLTNPKNTKGALRYQRYVSQALFQNYPQMALTNTLGLTNKGEPQLKAPTPIDSLIDYATKENTSLSKVQDECISSIFKYGLVGLKVDIANDSPLTESPRIEVIEGINLVDGLSQKIGNIDYFKWILIDYSKKVFDESSKRYTTIKMYKLLALDGEGLYYEAIFLQPAWGTFDILNPSASSCISLVYPEFYGNIDFIPFVAINSNNCELKWETPFIQNLINTSLSIFQLDADLRMGLFMQSNGFLAIYGTNSKPDEVTQGMFAVNIFKDSGASAEYVTPDATGMQAQMSKLTELNAQAVQQIYSILNVSEGSSGDALALRISASTTSLVSLVKNVASGITRICELIGKIMNVPEDSIEYIPYLDFAKIETAESIKTEIINSETTAQTPSGVVETTNPVVENAEQIR